MNKCSTDVQQLPNKNEQSKVKESKEKDIILYLNDKCKTKFRDNTPKTKSLIQARFNDGFNVEDFKTVIDKKSKQWLNTEYDKYLRPETLFGTKFESYLNEKIISLRESEHQPQKIFKR